MKIHIQSLEYRIFFFESYYCILAYIDSVCIKQSKMNEFS